MGSNWKAFFEKKLRYHLSFSNTEQTLFGIESKFLQQGCQKNYLNFESFPDIERKFFALLSKKSEAGLPELHSTCLQELFETCICRKRSPKFLLSFSDIEQ